MIIKINIITKWIYINLRQCVVEAVNIETVNI